jgi:hypothetical protein
VVLYVGVEDGIEDTVVPRLIAAGADLALMKAVYYPVDDNGASPQFTIPSDVPQLRQLVEKYEAELVIIDPITAFLDDKIDPYKDASVRRALGPIAQMAEDTDCTVVMILHFNKKVGQRAQHRGTGSPAFTNLSRAVMSALPDPENTGLSVLASVKNNNAPKPKSLAYEIVEETFREGRRTILASKIVWLGESDISADQAAGAEGHEPKKTAPTREAIKALILDILADGPRPASEVIDELVKHGGYSKRTIQDTAKHMGVETKRVFEGKKLLYHQWSLASAHSAPTASRRLPGEKQQRH